MKEKDLQCETATKIVESATALFNINGYAGTSINDIAKNAKLSKGILYHYFENKDSLYLHCARMCIKNYCDFIEENTQDNGKITDPIMENISLRLVFFDEYPQYRTFFSYLALRKPTHLSDELIEIWRELRQKNAERLKALIGDLKLGKGVTDIDILVFTMVLQSSTTLMLQDGIDEDVRKKNVEHITRVIKIFINGLKEDVE